MKHTKELGKIYDKDNYIHTWETDKNDFFLFWQENHVRTSITLKDPCFLREMRIFIDAKDFLKIAKSFIKEYEEAKNETILL
jgi:hypothetical protein